MIFQTTKNINDASQCFTNISEETNVSPDG